jgi:GDP-L-fucose synthase
MKLHSKIYVAGHSGLVGSAIIKNLQEKGFTNIIYRSHKELNLIDTHAVARFFEEERPEYVFLAAAKVGGIIANNTYRGEFIYENLMIQNNVIHQSYLSNVKKLMFLGSTCIYPKNAPQPLKEEYLLTGELEYTNEPYAIAKIAGIKLCESYNLQYGCNFISVMPTNLYGPNDNFDLEKSHVVPALIRKIHLAKLVREERFSELIADTNSENLEVALAYLKRFNVSSEKVEIWGTGNPRRELLWSEDMADACVYLMQNKNFQDLYVSETEIRNTHINIGTGTDLSIRELAEQIRQVVGYDGALVFNSDMPDGTYRKITDVSKLQNTGWKHNVEITDGINLLYAWYLNSKSKI